MDSVDSFLRFPDKDAMEVDANRGAEQGDVPSQHQQPASNSWASTGTMVTDYQVQSPPRQASRSQHNDAAADQSLDLLFDMDGVDELPMQHVGLHDLELLPDVPPIGVDLDSLQLQSPLQQQQHQQQFSPQQPFSPQHYAASPQQEQQWQQQQQPQLQPQPQPQLQQQWSVAGWQSAPAVSTLQQASSTAWQRQAPPAQPSTMTWIPVSAPAVQFSSSWGGGPHTAPHPVPFGAQPFEAGQSLATQPFGSQPSTQQHFGSAQPAFGKWGSQQQQQQQLSSSVPQQPAASSWGGRPQQGHAFYRHQHHHHQQHQQQSAPLMYDFGAPPEEQPLLPLGSPPLDDFSRDDSSPDASPAVKPAAAVRQAAQPVSPPRRTSARLPRLPRLLYDVYADSLTPSGSFPSDTPRSSSSGGGGATPTSSDSLSFGGFSAGERLRASSYSAGHGFGSMPKGASSSGPSAGGTPKSLPAGNAFPKSRSGRTVRPHARLLDSPEVSGGDHDGGRETTSYGRDREWSGSGQLGGRLGSGIGPLSKRKRQVHPPAALRDGAEFADNQRRKQHNPWTREETEALVEGVEHCGGAGHWQDIKRLGYPAIASRSAVDLKDKWRNLLRIAELPPALAAARVDKKREAPSMEILERVRALTLAGQQRAAAGEARAAASSRSRARGRRG